MVFKKIAHKKFRFLPQTERMDCGAACLQMIVQYYGTSLPLDTFRQLSFSGKTGTSFYNLGLAAEQIGFMSHVVKSTPAELLTETPFPAIVHWNQNHFVVVVSAGKKKVKVADPAHGMIHYTHREFAAGYCGDGEMGYVMGLLPDEGFLKETAPFFIEHKYSGESQAKAIRPGYRLVKESLKRHKKAIWLLVACLALGSLLQFIFPFITQSVVDTGIGQKDIGFIWLVLLIRLLLFVAQAVNDMVRSFLLLNISARFNISLVSGFFKKLLKLPFAFFDSKFLGDILQRIHDNDRIEHFLTGNVLNTMFSLLNFLLFSIILAFYNSTVFLVYFAGTVVYFVWISFFLKYRAALDYKRFQQHAKSQGSIIELLTGMQEIKLNNAEKQSEQRLETLQKGLLHINIQSLKLEQVQMNGASLINELKNILITFFSAQMVLEGHLTLGMMLAITFIIGQLNGPVTQFVGFIQQWQDAKLSFNRIAEIHQKKEEQYADPAQYPALPQNLGFEFDHISFSYDQDAEHLALEQITVQIPANKTTAIVGPSGSGKSTLLRLLARFYEPFSGTIKTGGLMLNEIPPNIWRSYCGVVMQDGYLFSDTITRNICIGFDEVDQERLVTAARIAEIHGFIESLPLQYDTKIGMDGAGLSMGQKQRILIARAVYKNPQFIFLDEATSSLDANSEKKVTQNLARHFAGKTTVVAAHRLSTIKNADLIIVMDGGRIIETGNHEELMNRKEMYYTLMQNQVF